MVWRTAGRDRKNRPARPVPHQLTDPKPVEPQLVRVRTHLGTGGQSNQKQTHTQQAEQSHAVCWFQFSPSLWARRYPGKHLRSTLPGTVIPMAH
jgi:hypothetical protein